MATARKKVKSTNSIIIIFAAALVIACVLATTRILYIEKEHEQDISALKREFDSMLDEYQRTGYSKAFEQVAPFIYQVKATQITFKNKYSFKDFFSGENEIVDTIYTITYGSGMSVEYDGSNYVVTARHNIPGAQKIELLNNTGEIFSADLVREDSLADIAILTFQGTQAAKAPIVGDDEGKDDLIIGQPIFMVGFPFGSTQFCYSGMIGGFATDPTELEQFIIGRSVSSGMSGGGVFDYKGKLLGIILKSGKTKAEAYTSALSLKEFSSFLSSDFIQ